MFGKGTPTIIGNYIALLDRIAVPWCHVAVRIEMARSKVGVADEQTNSCGCVDGGIVHERKVSLKWEMLFFMRSSARLECPRH